MAVGTTGSESRLVNGGSGYVSVRLSSLEFAGYSHALNEARQGFIKICHFLIMFCRQTKRLVFFECEIV